MKYLLIAAFLYGFVHPGAKLILDQNIDLLTFCVLLVLIRLIPQAAIVFYKKEFYLPTRRHLWLLLGVGIAGAFMQIFEFAGLTEGLSVPVVTFLVYTHPLWSLVLSKAINNTGIKRSDFIKVCLGVAGLALILWDQIPVDSNFRILPYLAPITAALCLSLWINLSHKIQNEGISFTKMSFFYDVIGLFIILGVWMLRTTPEMMTNAKAWIMEPKHFFAMAAYSIFVGLIPNLLFYLGNKMVSPTVCSLVLLMEPVLSVLISLLIWEVKLTPGFWIGALMILFVNLPKIDFAKTIDKT
jgi:drug/metabolite transporter (DMT)-like permease